ncbi:hypothetical protein KCP74_19900 [Salmonella enterica subsp. enterica]|nr:hypothetical protein KCP74_19900 [Salmonella enterica subsp. enterica]
MVSLTAILSIAVMIYRISLINEASPEVFKWVSGNIYDAIFSIASGVEYENRHDDSQNRYA